MVMTLWLLFLIIWQRVSYIAEHVVGTGSFGVVFQVHMFNAFNLLSVSSNHLYFV